MPLVLSTLAGVTLHARRDPGAIVMLDDTGLRLGAVDRTDAGVAADAGASIRILDAAGDVSLALSGRPMRVSGDARLDGSCVESRAGRHVARRGNQVLGSFAYPILALRAVVPEAIVDPRGAPIASVVPVGLGVRLAFEPGADEPARLLALVLYVAGLAGPLPPPSCRRYLWARAL